LCGPGKLKEQQHITSQKNISSLHHYPSFFRVSQQHGCHGDVLIGLALYVHPTPVTHCYTAAPLPNPMPSIAPLLIALPALNHSSADTEAEYDRLRDLARQEAAKRGSCFDRAHQAYESGDGARAHQLSEEGKSHAAKMEQYNRQARDYIFRANNASDRVDGDTIDLHGLFVEEAEDVLEERIKNARQRGETHLHVIVGKGNHSTNHVQKIKPRVEQVCRELGLQYRTEENEGRIFVNLQGGSVDHMPPPPNAPSYGGYPGGGQHHGGGQHAGGHGQQHGGQQHGGQHQQQNQNDEIEQMVKKGLPKLLKKLGCCTVM
jgi:DNA-nicking Smr family endonuclease